VTAAGIELRSKWIASPIAVDYSASELGE